MRIEADNLQDAFAQASKELGCSVTQLDIEIIQHPSSGVLGFFKKSAIIEAHKEGEKRVKQNNVKKEVKKEPNKAKDFTQKDRQETFSENKKTPLVDMKVALPEIEKGVKELLSQSCFDMEVIKVEAYSEDTVLIELNGEDAALLIGKEGYRYKAFSYLLYNWINIKYGFGIRFEVAEFLKNQEISAQKYIGPIIERIHSNGRGQTKPLDGVWIKIALEILRKEFPEKYVGIKTGKEGVKYIVVNDFNKK